MSGGGYRGRGFGPRGVRSNNWNGGPFGGPRFRHPNFTPPRLPGNRPALPDAWVDCPPRVPFQHWQQNGVMQFQNFPQPNAPFRNNGIMPPFHPNSRGRPPNLRGGRGFFGNARPPAPPFPGHNANFRPRGPLVQKDNVSEQSAPQILPGSEEERQQKIAETASRLKQKLSSVTKEDMITFWEDDFSVLKPTSKDEFSSVKLMPEWKNAPDLDLTFNDFKDIGRVNPDSGTRLSVENRDFDGECCIIDIDNNKDTTKSTDEVIDVPGSVDIPDNSKEFSQNNEYPDLEILDYQSSVCNSSQESQGPSNSNVTVTLLAHGEESAKGTLSTVYENPCTDEPKDNDTVVIDSGVTLNSSQLADKTSPINVCTGKENVCSVSYSLKNQTQFSSTSDNIEDVLLLSPTFDPCTPPPTFIPKGKAHDKVLSLCSQKPPPSCFGQEEQLQPPPAFDPRLSLQERSCLLAQASTDALRSNPGAVKTIDTITDFNKPAIITNFSQLPPMVQPLPFATGIQMSYPSALPPMPQPQMMSHIYSIPPPPTVQSPVFHQERPLIDLSDSNKIQQSEISDVLEDMNNAMKFAQEIMNVASEGKNILECSIPEPPLLESNISTKSSPKRKEKEDKSQKFKMDIPCDSKLRPKETQKKCKFGSEKLTTENVSTKQNAKSNAEIPLKDDQRRRKVAFNFNSKSKKIVSHKWQKKRNENDNKSKTRLTPSNPTASLSITKTTAREESRSANKYSRHGTVSGKKDKPKIPVTRPQENRATDGDDRNILQTKVTPENIQSNSSPKASQRPYSNNKQNRRMHAPSSELSWKNRVISRFLKMSKSDICNMVNNSSLRKFDIAMKHLVKQKRSSLSLEMRNTEDEKIKSYDRDEFMSQLNAMLDPGAIVDVSNLPAEFIHHLSEVLQLDPMPSDYGLPVFEPDVMIHDSKDTDQIDTSEVLIIEDKNKQSIEEPVQLNTPCQTSQLIQNREEEVNLAHVSNFVTDLVAEEHDTLSTQETQQDLTVNKSIPMFNIADLDDIFSEVIAKVNSEQTVDLKKMNTEAENICKPSVERLNDKETTVSVSLEPAVDVVNTVVDFENIFSAEIANNHGSKTRKDNGLSRLSQIGIRRWSNRDQDDSVAFRNLTKEEWDAKYGTSVSLSNATPNESTSKEPYSRPSSQGSKDHHSRRSCSLDSPKNRSDITAEILYSTKNTSEQKTTGSNEHLDLLGIKRLTKSTENSSSSSSNSSNSSTDTSSDSSSQSGDDRPSDITKLLKVIKEKEKIAKTRSFSETMRDEITAEIERTRQEKKKHKERKFRKRDRKRRDKREKRRKPKKKRRKKSVETDTSNSDTLETEQPPRLLSESEIKKEVLIKEEKNTTEKQNQLEDNIKTKNDLHLSSSKQETPRFSEPTSTNINSDLTSTRIIEKSAPALPIMQLRTKAQLKQMPETSKNDGQGVSNGDKTKSFTFEAEKTQNSLQKKHAEVTAKIILPVQESNGNMLASLESQRQPAEGMIEEQNLLFENYSENKLHCVQEKRSAETKNDKNMSIEKAISFQKDLYTNVTNVSSKEKIKRDMENTLKENDTHIPPNENSVKGLPKEENKKNVEKIAGTDKSAKKLDIKTYKERMLQRKMRKQERLAESLKDPSLLTENLLKIPARMTPQATSSNTSQSVTRNINNNDSLSDVSEKVNDLSCADGTTKTMPKQSVEIKVKSFEVLQEESLPNAKGPVEGTDDSLRSELSLLKCEQIRKSVEQTVQYNPTKTDVTTEPQVKSKLYTNKLKDEVENNTDASREVMNQSSNSSLDLQIFESEKPTTDASEGLNKFKNIRSEGSKELKLKKEKAKKAERKEFTKKRHNSGNSLEDKMSPVKQNIFTNITVVEPEKPLKPTKHNDTSGIDEKSVKNSSKEINTPVNQESDRIDKKEVDLQVQNTDLEERAVTEKGTDCGKFSEASNELDLQGNTNNNTIMMEGVLGITEIQREQHDLQKEEKCISTDTDYNEVSNSNINNQIEINENQVSGSIAEDINDKDDAVIKEVDKNFVLDNSDKEIPQSASQFIPMENIDIFEDNVDHPSSLHSPESIDSPFKGFPKEPVSCVCSDQLILENINLEFDESHDLEINHKSENRDESNSSSLNNILVKISLDNNIDIPYDDVAKNAKNPSQQSSQITSTEDVPEEAEASTSVKDLLISSTRLKTDPLSKQGKEGDSTNEEEKPGKCVENVINEEVKDGISKKLDDAIEKENCFKEPSSAEVTALPAGTVDTDEFTNKNIINTSIPQTNINTSDEIKTANAGIQSKPELNVQSNSFTSITEHIDTEALLVNNFDKSDKDSQSGESKKTEKRIEIHENEKEVSETEIENEGRNIVCLEKVVENNSEICSNENNFPNDINVNATISAVSSNTDNDILSNYQTLQNPAVQVEQMNEVNELLPGNKEDLLKTNVGNKNLSHDKKTKNTGLHGVSNKPRLKSKYEKKRNISQRNLEDAVKSDTVTLVSKETIISRMIQIDVEIHKLMMEKMALYKLLETKTILEEVSPDSSTVSENKIEDVANIRSQTPTVMSQLMQNIETGSVGNVQLPTADNTELIRKKKADHKSDHPNLHKHKSLMKSDNAKRKRNQSSVDCSSEDEKVMRFTESSRTSALKKNKRPRNERIVTWEASGETESEVNTQNKKASIKDTTKSILKKNSSNSKERKNSPAEIKDHEERQETSMTVKNHGSDVTSCGLNENLIDSTDDIIHPKEQVLDSYNQQAKFAGSTTSVATSIYSDESTMELPEQESLEKNNPKRKNTGLALLEESFKREIAISKKLKTVARKKKKMQLRSLLDSVNSLTPEEEELPLNKLYIKKLQQKRNLLVSLHSPNKALNATDIAPGNSTKVSEHISEIIDAVAENKIQELYQKPNEMQVTDNSVERVTSTQADDVSGSTTDKQQSLNNGVVDSKKTEADTEILEEQSKDQTHSLPSLTFANNTFAKVTPSAEAMDEENKSTEPEEGGPQSCDVMNTETEVHTPADDIATTSHKGTETPTEQRILEDKINQDFNDEVQRNTQILHVKNRNIDSPKMDAIEANAEAKLHADRELININRCTAEENNTKDDKRDSTRNTTPVSSVVTKLLVNTTNENDKSSLATTSKQKDNPDLDCSGGASECDLINQNIDGSVANLELKEQQGQTIKEASTMDTQLKNMSAESVPSSQTHEISEAAYTNGKTGKKIVVKHKGARSLKFIKRRYRKKRLRRKDVNESLLNVEGSRQRTSSNQEKNSRVNLTSTSLKLVLSPEEVAENSPCNVQRKFSALNLPNTSKKQPVTGEIISDEPASAMKVQQRPQKRKQHSTLTMMNCKVKLVDSKYTILKPDVSPNALRQLGISAINNFNVRRKSLKEETPMTKSTKGKDPLEAPLLLEKKTAAQNTKHEDIALHLTHEDSSKFTAKPDSTIKDNVEREIGQTRVTRTRKLQRANLTQITECFDPKSPAKFREIDAPTISHEILNVDPVSTCTENSEIEVLDEETVNDVERTKHDEESSTSHDLEIVGETKQSRTQYTVHKGPILDIKIFDDSILAASEDGMIYRYNQSSNGILNIYKGHKAAVTCLYVHKVNTADLKREWMYSGALDGTLRCYDITTGLEVREAAQVGSPVQCMDQSWGVIFIGTKSGHVSRFHIKSNDIKGDTIQFSDKSVLALKATNEGPRKVLIVASRNQPITIRDAQTGLFLRTICGQRSHTVYSLMRDNNFIYCGTSSTSIPVFDFTNGEQTVQYNAGVGIVCMRLYHQLLFAGCYDGNIYVFDTRNHKLICSIPGPGNMLLSMEIVHHKIIAGSKDKRLQSWLMPKQVRALLNKR